jgi:hypothetical protein
MVIARLFSRPQQKPPPLPCITAGLICREHGGKTTLLDGLDWHCLGEPLPSGLRFGIPRPEQIPGRLNRADEAVAACRTRGRGSTQQARAYTFAVLDQGEELARIQFRDVVGQDLTFPTRANREARKGYVQFLRQADVLVPVFPCPPARATHSDERRLKKTYLYNEGFLRAALTGRSSPRPVNLLAAVTRLDARYSDLADARRRIYREFLRWLEDQLGVLAGRDDVGAAWVVPVSFFGFGSATFLPPEQVGRDSTFGEGRWLLKGGARPRPYNLMTFLVTAMVSGLRNREADAFPDVDRAADLCRRLTADLEALGGWRDALCEKGGGR